MKIDKNSWYARMYEKKYGLGDFDFIPLPTDGCLFWRRVLITVLLRAFVVGIILFILELCGYAVAKDCFKIQSDTTAAIWGIPLLVVWFAIICAFFGLMKAIGNGIVWLWGKARGPRQVRKTEKKVGKFKELFLAVKERYCPVIEWVDSSEKAADK